MRVLFFLLLLLLRWTTHAKRSSLIFYVAISAPFGKPENSRNIAWESSPIFARGDKHEISNLVIIRLLLSSRCSKTALFRVRFRTVYDWPQRECKIYFCRKTLFVIVHNYFFYSRKKPFEDEFVMYPKILDFLNLTYAVAYSCANAISSLVVACNTSSKLATISITSLEKENEKREVKH